MQVKLVLPYCIPPRNVVALLGCVGRACAAESRVCEPDLFQADGVLLFFISF